MIWRENPSVKLIQKKTPYVLENNTTRQKKSTAKKLGEMKTGSLARRLTKRIWNKEPNRRLLVTIFLNFYIFKFYIWAGWAFFESVKQFDILSPWGWSPLVHHIQVFYLVLPRLPHLHMSYLEPSHPLAVIAMTLFLQIFVAQKVWWWCWWWW